MIRKVSVIILIVLLLAVPASAEGAVPVAQAKAVLLVHPASGCVLYARNENDPMLIASTTKLMTALTALKALSPDQTAEIRAEWTRVEGSAMYLRAGEEYSVLELLEGLLLASGNDAALALAGMAASDADVFVERMNDEAQALGLRNTHFDNPHGLDSPGQYSTAADLAIIMQAVCRQPLLRDIIGMKACNVHGLTLENHNKLLRSCPGVFGGKTGYTKAAGRCLVSCCERDGMELICVTLSDPNDWRDHCSLYDWAYGTYREVRLKEETEPPALSVIGGAKDTVKAVPGQDIVLCLEKGAKYTVEYTMPSFVFAPVAAEEPAGEMIVKTDGAPPLRIGLFTGELVPAADDALRVWREIVDRFIGIYAV